MKERLVNDVMGYLKPAMANRQEQTRKEKQYSIDNETYALEHSLSSCEKKDGAALLIAGGPSYKKNIDIIRKLNSKVITFAASRVYNELIDNLVIPDYVVHLDSHSHERWFNKPINKTKLIAPIQTSPELRDYWPYEIYYFRGEIDFVKKSHNRKRVIGKDLPIIECGGHVGGAMISLAAAYFKLNPICLIGYDYATDPEGSFYINDKAPEGDYKDFVSCRGRKVKTNPKYFAHMIFAFGLAVKNKNTKWYSASNGIFGILPDYEKNLWGYYKDIEYITLEKFYDLFKDAKGSI